MKRTPLSRGKPMKRSKLKPKKRSSSEFARIYGSKARVEWVKSLPCAAGMVSPCNGPIENAHWRTDGMGRKAGYAAIAPLCSKHHREYDEYLGLLAYPWARHSIVITSAAETAAAWQTLQETE